MRYQQNFRTVQDRATEGEERVEKPLPVISTFEKILFGMLICGALSTVILVHQYQESIGLFSQF